MSYQNKLRCPHIKGHVYKHVIYKEKINILRPLATSVKGLKGLERGDLLCNHLKRVPTRTFVHNKHPYYLRMYGTVDLSLPS